MELVHTPGLTNGRRVVRAFAVLVFAVGLALSGARVVGTRFEPILLIPAVLAVSTGWLLSRSHLVARALSQAVVFAGSAVLVAYVSDGTSSSVVKGLLEGPRQVVTTAWPSPRFATIFVALSALIFVAAAVSTDLAMRVRWRALAIAPLVVAMVAMIAVGAPDGPQWQPVVVGAASSFVLLWIGLDDRVASVRAGFLVAVAAGLAALVTTLGVGVAVAQRANPRHREDADTQLLLVDPLADVAGQLATDPPRDLYRVESPELGQLKRWRLTALDVYNGESWSTSGRTTPIGNRLDPPTGAATVSVKLTAALSSTDLWVSPGLVLRSSSPVESDAKRRVIRISGTERPAETVFTVEPFAEFDPATAGTVGTLKPSDIENSFKSLASTLAPTGTVAEQIAKLASTLHDDYTLNEATPGGLQQRLVDDFLRNTKVGNRDQFVTGFVLLARSLGVDARIATGYKLEEVTSTPATITTANADAWAEVRVDGLGGARRRADDTVLGDAAVDAGRPAGDPARPTAARSATGRPGRSQRARSGGAASGEGQRMDRRPCLGTSGWAVHGVVAVAARGLRAHRHVEEGAAPEGVEGARPGSPCEHRMDTGNRCTGRRRRHPREQSHQRRTRRGRRADATRRRPAARPAPAPRRRRHVCHRSL